MGPPHFQWDDDRTEYGVVPNFDRASRLATVGLITVAEFAQLARLSRRQIDRLRKRRPDGFPRELELGSGQSKHRSCPRFKLAEVRRWIDSRALW